MVVFLSFSQDYVCPKGCSLVGGPHVTNANPPKYSLYLMVYYNLHQMLEFQPCDILITSYGTMFLLPVRLDMPVTLDDQTNAN